MAAGVLCHDQITAKILVLFDLNNKQANNLKFHNFLKITWNHTLYVWKKLEI